MQIIVAQKCPDHLEKIRRYVAELDEERDQEILYTSDPNAVEVNAEGEAFVVSGNVFESPTSGTDFGRRIKERNPGALFFIFSFDPPDFPDAKVIDGIIPKGYSNDKDFRFLAMILASDLDGMTPQKLGAKFPRIRIYTLREVKVGIRVQSDF